MSFFNDTCYETPAVRSRDLDDPGNYFILEGNPRAQPEYGDCFVAMRRLSYKDLKRSFKEDWALSFLPELKRRNGVYPNPQTLAPLEKGNGVGNYTYLSNLSVEDALKLNLYLGNKTVNPRQFVDILKLIRDGLAGNRPVFDGNGTCIDSRVLGMLHDDLLGRMTSGNRGEFLDVYFLMMHGVMYLATDHELLPDGRLFSRHIQPLESLLTQSKVGVGINCNIYLNSANSQGFPPLNIRGGKCRYWAPQSDSFGSFTIRDSVPEFNFKEIPSVLRSPTIGIRAVRPKQ